MSWWQVNSWKPAARSPTASCTPDRTLLIASTSRFYVMNEKIAMGDGRYDQQRLLDAIRKNAQSSILFDMEAVAKATAP